MFAQWARRLRSPNRCMQTTGHPVWELDPPKPLPRVYGYAQITRQSVHLDDDVRPFFAVVMAAHYPARLHLREPEAQALPYERILVHGIIKEDVYGSVPILEITRAVSFVWDDVWARGGEGPKGFESKLGARGVTFDQSDDPRLSNPWVDAVNGHRWIHRCCPRKRRESVQRSHLNDAALFRDLLCELLDTAQFVLAHLARDREIDHSSSPRYSAPDRLQNTRQKWLNISRRMISSTPRLNASAGPPRPPRMKRGPSTRQDQPSALTVFGCSFRSGLNNDVIARKARLWQDRHRPFRSMPIRPRSVLASSLVPDDDGEGLIDRARHAAVLGSAVSRRGLRVAPAPPPRVTRRQCA